MEPFQDNKACNNQSYDILRTFWDQWWHGEAQSWDGRRQRGVGWASRPSSPTQPSRPRRPTYDRAGDHVSWDGRPARHLRPTKSAETANPR